MGSFQSSGISDRILKVTICEILLAASQAISLKAISEWIVPLNYCTQTQKSELLCLFKLSKLKYRQSQRERPHICSHGCCYSSLAPAIQRSGPSAAVNVCPLGISPASVCQPRVGSSGRSCSQAALSGNDPHISRSLPLQPPCVFPVPHHGLFSSPSQRKLEGTGIARTLPEPSMCSECSRYERKQVQPISLRVFTDVLSFRNALHLHIIPSGMSHV